MRILFLGEVRGNGGPDNVNKGITDNLSEKFLVVKNKSKMLFVIELFWKCLQCNVIVVSGLSRKNCIAVGIANFFKKKTAYIMHGCAEYECVINNQNNCERAIEQERYLLERVTLILPVSKRYSEWVKDRYPQYANKTNYLYNGVDLKIQQNRTFIKKKGTLIATGADREIKNNTIVAEIVEEMSGKVEFEICGTIYHSELPVWRHSYYTGMIPQELYLEHLKKSEVFILNSLLESFSMSAIEALLCGCSLLLSETAGVVDLLQLEETDIIHDPMNKEEIKSKIMYLLENPNNERILAAFHPEDWSYQKSVGRLECLCKDLMMQ